jgi:hypothetical protein
MMSFERGSGARDWIGCTDDAAGGRQDSAAVVQGPAQPSTNSSATPKVGPKYAKE